VRYLPLWVALVLLNSTVSSSALSSLEVGMEAPDFRLHDTAHSAYGFADLKGEKLTVLVFWATWSSNSQKALRQMQELRQTYAGSGLSVIAINVDRQEMNEAVLARIRQLVERQQITLPVLVDQGLRVFNDYGVIAVPSLVVLNEKRVIRRELSGYPLLGAADLKQYLEAALENRPLTATQEVVGYQPDKRAVRFWNMGRSSMKSERTADMAEGWFKKAIAAAPDFTLPYLSLGTLYYRQHRLTEAQQQFEAVLQRKPDNALALGSLGQLALDQGNLAGAEQRLTAALQADESYLPGYYLMGVVKGRQKELEQALVWFRQAEARNPREYRLFVYRGQLFEDQDNLAAAAAEYRKALELIVEQP
jgi:tetratricopeptide (TPR) repeat protein